MRIPFQRPTLPETSEIDRYLERSREERWFSNGGPCWRLLRDRLSDRVGAYCVPVASGTLGLMAALAAVLDDSRPAGRGALMPSFTFVATAQAATWAGLEPRLADIAPDDWHLDPEGLEQILGNGDDFAAALTVSAFGTPPPAETRWRWQRACERAAVPLIVDSAAGFGAVADDGAPIGTQGDIEVVSFHATKPFAIGEGGAVFTKDSTLRDRLELAVNFGFRPDRTVALPRGLNAKMSELHAATALVVLDRFDAILAHRREAAASIRAQAGPAVSWQAGAERSTWQFLPVAFPDRRHRDQLVATLSGKIETRVYYEPLHRLVPDYQALGKLEHTNDLHSRIVCLPMANDLSPAERDTIGAALAAA